MLYISLTSGSVTEITILSPWFIKADKQAIYRGYGFCTACTALVKDLRDTQRERLASVLLLHVINQQACDMLNVMKHSM